MLQITPSEEPVVVTFAVPTLASEIGMLSNDDLSQLEDDLNFYAFTNIASPLLKRMMPLLSAASDGKGICETNAVPGPAPQSRVIPRRIPNCRQMAIAV